MKWTHSVDQWFEDKVWTRVPKEYATPHMFFLIGCLTGAGFIILLHEIIEKL